MMSYGQLFLVILPVFAMIGIGAALRHWRLITEEGENSLFNLVVKVTTPCLIFESVAGNPALREPGNLVFPPLAGFGLTLLSMALGWYSARALGLTIGHGLRTFALAAGLTNYGYLPLPLMDAMFGPESRAVLLVRASRRWRAGASCSTCRCSPSWRRCCAISPAFPPSCRRCS
jgi:malate permease and related proteins